MKKKILVILFVIIILRIIIIFIVKDDPVFFLSPRNFNGRGLLTAPSWIDFVIPLIIILFLYQKWLSMSFDLRRMYNPIFAATFLIGTPILIGMLLPVYTQKSLVKFDFNFTLFVRYILFVLSFISINFIADTISSKKKSLKYFILILFIVFIAYTQDVFASGNYMYILLGLINSVGFSTVVFSIGMRRSYKTQPFATIIAVSIAGIFLIFFLYNVLSVSFFTIFLPSIASMIIAIVLYKNWKLKTKISVGAIPFIIALFLNFALPKIVSPELANKLIESRPKNEFQEEQIGKILIKYKNQEFRDIAVKFAKVIQAANESCNREFGFSPNVKELIINGFGPGGFHAEFPNKIVGNITSEEYLKNCNDSIFLNSGDLSENFPDPVNAILHEYSHLFGVIPYYKWWPGAEEEGWATYSATQLSKILYKNLGLKLWQPKYDYFKQSDKIIKRNLSGKAVVWSHPNEFGGFILWYNIGKKIGIKKLYKDRWNNSMHNINGSLFILSDPAKADKIVSLFGKSFFEKYGYLTIEKFGNIYSKSEYLYMAKTMGIDENKISKIYEFMKMQKIDPSVPIP